MNSRSSTFQQRKYASGYTAGLVAALVCAAFFTNAAKADRYDVYLVPGTSADGLAPNVLPLPTDQHPALGNWTPHSIATPLAVPNTGDSILGIIKSLLPPDADIHVHVIAKGSATDSSNWTGEDSQQARQAASDELAKVIAAQPAGDHRIGFAYSHGDTVLENAISEAKLPFDSVISVAAPGIAEAPDDLVKTRANFIVDGDMVATNAGDGDVNGPRASPGTVHRENSWNVEVPNSYINKDGKLVDISGPIRSHTAAQEADFLTSVVSPALAYLGKAVPGLKATGRQTHLMTMKQLLAMQCDDKACRDSLLKDLPNDPGVHACLINYAKRLDEIDKDEAETVADVAAHRDRYDYGSKGHKDSDDVIKSAHEQAAIARQLAEKTYRDCVQGG